MKPKVLIVGSGHTPTGRCRALWGQMFLDFIDASYHKIDAEIVGNKVHQAIVDDCPPSIVNLDLSDLEKRYSSSPYAVNNLGADHPSRKREPKGPRGKWGKL